MRFPPAAVAALLAASFILAACAPDRAQIVPENPAVTAAPTGAAVAPDDSPVYDQELTWRRCGELECATVLVPIDWTDPAGPTAEVEINRHAATDAERRIGSLLINPGGPGGSGLDLTLPFVAGAGDELLAAYDVIGFDPRGVGESTPVQCGDADTVDAYYLPDVDLETQEQIDAAREATAEFAAGCRELSGPLIENVDTASVARDMDVIRAVLGDSELHYLGYSYGTQLGATYAELYPDTVGRMVLDGAVDFLLDPETASIDQARGFEGALVNFVDWCLGEEDCPLDSDPDRALEQIRDIGLTARDSGYRADGGERVNGNLMLYGIAVTLYDQGSWPYLQAGLDEVIDGGTADIFFQLAHFYLDKDVATGEYLSNSQWAFTAVGCLDAGDVEPTTEASLRDFEAAVEEAAPTLGWWFASSLGCDGWPWTAKEPVTALEAADAAAPLLVIGTTNDPATPLRWAESLTEQLASSTLLVYDGEGHTAYGRSNQCVIDAVDGYLVEGQMPDSGTRC